MSGDVAAAPRSAPAPVDVVAMFGDESFADELALNRVILRRLITSAEAQEELSLRELVRIGRLFFSGGQAVARLLRKEHALSGQAAAAVAGAIDKALDELGTEWGVEL